MEYIGVYCSTNAISFALFCAPIPWNAIFGTAFTMRGDNGKAKADAQSGKRGKREKYREKYEEIDIKREKTKGGLAQSFAEHARMRVLCTIKQFAMCFLSRQQYDLPYFPINRRRHAETVHI